MKPIHKYFFFGGIAFLMGLRFLHFGPDIDAPHDWRQCDTAWYIWDFYQNGIDLLHPTVCWMGSKNILALEFPLPEAIVAVSYQVFGESMFVARLIFLVFFAGGVYYFYKITDFLFGAELARLATLVYLALPLGLFYSRAIHIDFSAILFAHAMVYYFLQGVEKRRGEYLLLSSGAALLALVIKAPYAFYFGLPMLYFAIRQKAFWWTLSRGGGYAVAVLGFVVWQQHVNAINSASPDWDYILHYRKMTPNSSWYFGSLTQRLSLYHWWILLQRGILEVAGIGGIVFLIGGGWWLKWINNSGFLLWWMVALVAYVLIFFNLNFIHNYYQLPLLAPVAILIAGAMHLASTLRPMILPVLLTLLVTANVIFAETHYYQVATADLEIGNIIRENTPDTALVMVTSGIMDCRNPKILYRARRRGWSIEEAALRPEVITRLTTEEGAQFWAYIGVDLPQKSMGDFLNSLPQPKIFNLPEEKRKVYLFELEE